MLAEEHSNSLRAVRRPPTPPGRPSVVARLQGEFGRSPDCNLARDLLATGDKQLLRVRMSAVKTACHACGFSRPPNWSLSLGLCWNSLFLRRRHRPVQVNLYGDAGPGQENDLWQRRPPGGRFDEGSTSLIFSYPRPRSCSAIFARDRICDRRRYGSPAFSRDSRPALSPREAA